MITNLVDSDVGIRLVEWLLSVKLTTLTMIMPPVVKLISGIHNRPRLYLSRISLTVTDQFLIVVEGMVVWRMNAYFGR